MEYSAQRTTFCLWCPQAQLVEVRVFRDGHGSSLISKHCMQLHQEYWYITLEGDFAGKFYTYQATINNQRMQEVVDPYASAVGVNGKRAMIVDLRKTDPPDWQNDRSPYLNTRTDAIIYELHVRDFSIHPESGMTNKGKFLAFCETNTKCGHVTTGIDHLVELGVTHVQLLPVFDFFSVDEANPDVTQYNWGYDPLNCNTPEGSYSTDAFDGRVRIAELKQMISSLHQHGIGIIMDVVYNHTGLTDNAHFNQLYPGYYYRSDADGEFSNASGCGNEIASEQPMVRQYILDSIAFWMTEYHIDGFRFDLMGILDLETMMQINQVATAINPSVLLYGEGWTAADSPLPASRRAIKANIHLLPNIGVFCDELRDGLKGHWANDRDRGFVSGNSAYSESIKYGITAAVDHPSVRYEKVNYTDGPRALAPGQTINYASCHDNHTLWDKLQLSTNAPVNLLTDMTLLANTIVLTSQGIPLLHAGVEFLRTKKGDHNSYRSPDTINQLAWPEKLNNEKVFQYYKVLIALRKAHPVFRLTSANEIRSRLFFDSSPKGVISYRLYGRGLKKETWTWTKLVFNGTSKDIDVNMQGQGWYIVLNQGLFRKEKASQSVKVKPYSALIAYIENV
ncbi:MAG: type I pullulanase [Bacteroidota bacterium]